MMELHNYVATWINLVCPTVTSKDLSDLSYVSRRTLAYIDVVSDLDE